MFKAIANNLTPTINRILDIEDGRSSSASKSDDEDNMSIIPANAITLAEFNETLNRYPALIKKIAEGKNNGTQLEDLDRFRYVDAPARFSVRGGNRQMELEDVKKLMDWKLKHGKFRIGLQKHVASNTDEDVKATTIEAFGLYSKDEKHLEPVITSLSNLKGIGPATASLILAVHDPDYVLFFSDESYKWLVPNAGPLKYTTKEYEELVAKGKSLIGRLRVTPIQVEKVAFVMIKENEPAGGKGQKKAYSGKPRGRPKLPEGQRKVVPPPSGKPRGRPKLPEDQKKAKKVTASGKGRGRPPAAKKDDAAEAKATPAKKRKASEEATPGTGRSKRSKA